MFTVFRTLIHLQSLCNGAASGRFFELKLHTAAEHRVQEGLTKIHHSHFLLQKEHETLCFFLRTIFFKKTEEFPRNERNCTTCRECLETFNGQATGHLLWTCASYLDYEEWFENMASVFFAPEMHLENLMCICWHHLIPWKWSLQGHPRTDPLPVSTLSGEGCDAWQSEESLHFFDWKCWSGSCLEPQQFFQRMGAKDT